MATANHREAGPDPSHAGQGARSPSLRLLICLESFACHPSNHQSQEGGTEDYSGPQLRSDILPEMRTQMLSCLRPPLAIKILQVLFPGGLHGHPTPATPNLLLFCPPVAEKSPSCRLQLLNSSGPYFFISLSSQHQTWPNNHQSNHQGLSLCQALI